MPLSPGSRFATTVEVWRVAAHRVDLKAAIDAAAKVRRAARIHLPAGALA